MQMLVGAFQKRQIIQMLGMVVMKKISSVWEMS